MKLNKLTGFIALLAVASIVPVSVAQEPSMFGDGPGRNMISDAKDLPADWDTRSGKNILWKQPLGSQSYGGPVLADGRIYVGTNNEGLRNPEYTGDRGNLMVFTASDGEFLWQAVHAKLPSGRVHDWPLQGVCSAPYIEGDRLYYVSNQAEIIAADVNGFLDGENDGVFQDEDNNSKIGEDILWKLDMIDDLGVFPHNLAVGSPVIVDDILFTVTGNGVDEGHINIPSPDAPSFLAVNKNSGEVVWQSAVPGNNILHGQWSNPAYGVIAGAGQVIFPGGDGWMYSYEPATGELLWKFDTNPKDSTWELGGSGTRNNIVSTPVVHKDRVYIGVGQDPEHGEGDGQFWVIDATKRGDITETGAVWHRGGEEFSRTISTAAIADDILYIADLSGFLYALNADTGEEYWVYDAFAAIWGSAFVADGKVYLGDEDGDIAILKAGKEMELLAEPNVGSAVYTTPIAEDGVLYVASRNMLFAIQEGAQLATE